LRNSTQRSNQRNRKRGAALVEFALVLPLLLLVIAAVWEWGGIIREANILIEASRHGARVAGGMSADVARGDWCSPLLLLPYDSGMQSCSTAPSAGRLDTLQTLAAGTSMNSVCEYLSAAGLPRSDWEVRFQVEQGYDFPSENLTLGLPGRVFRITVQRSADATRPCVVCLLGFFSNALKNEGSSVFPSQQRCS
jgi:hypothetical protein